VGWGRRAGAGREGSGVGRGRRRCADAPNKSTTHTPSHVFTNTACTTPHTPRHTAPRVVGCARGGCGQGHTAALAPHGERHHSHLPLTLGPLQRRAHDSRGSSGRRGLHLDTLGGRSLGGRSLGRRCLGGSWRRRRKLKHDASGRHHRLGACGCVGAHVHVGELWVCGCGCMGVGVWARSGEGEGGGGGKGKAEGSATVQTHINTAACRMPFAQWCCGEEGSGEALGTGGP
jgi:hypothetical protein